MYLILFLTPNRFAFEAELQDTSRAEYFRIRQEINDLQSYQIPETDIEIDFKVLLTLIDGHTRVS